MKLYKSGDLVTGLVGMCLLLATTGVAHGQESLLIGPGDQVSVSYFDAPELNQHARITDAGDFPLQMGGNIKIAGLTPERAAAMIGDYMVSAHYLVNPRISVTVDQYATQNVSVLGDVHLPGAYPITTGRTVSEVLALAGGLMPDADRNIVVQRRVTGELLTFYNANSPTARPDSSAPGTGHTGSPQLLSREVLVYPGDTVRVAHSELVYALGDVGKPGGFPLTNNDAPVTVLQLIAFAGATNHTAVPSHARLIRKRPDGGYDDIHLPLSAMQKGKKPDQSLQAGDIIYVPFSYVRNALLGVTGLVSSAGSAAIYRAP